MIKQHLDLIIVALISLAIVMYDVVIDLFLNALDLLVEVIHLTYEWLELGMEHAVEHIFHTSRHGSQIVTFYILVLLASLLLYWLWRVLPRHYKQFIEFMRLALEQRKIESQAYWLSLTLINKVKLLSTATGVVCLAALVVM